MPRDPKARLHILNLDTTAKNLMDITVGVFYEKLLHPEDFNRNFISSKERSIVHTLHYFETRINDLLEMSMVSITLACAIGYIEFRTGHLWPSATCPRLVDWYTAFAQRPSMTQTRPAG